LCVLPLLKTSRFGDTRPLVSKELCHPCALASRRGCLSRTDRDAPRQGIAHPPESGKSPRLELTLNHDREEPYDLGTGYSHVAFAVEDLDALARRLKEAGGVDFESKPHAMKSGTRLFFVRDPDG